VEGIDMKTANETPADCLLGGIVRHLVDDDPAKLAAAVARASADLFGSPIDRDLFRAIAKASAYSPSPNPVAVRFIAEHDATGEAAAADVVDRLKELMDSCMVRPWHLWIDTAVGQLERDKAKRDAARLGDMLTACDGNPSPMLLDEIVRVARQLEDGATVGGRPPARDLLTIIDRWKRNESEKLISTGFDPIDRAFGGGLPVGLHGLAAAPGVGKSALAIQLALGAALHNPDARVLWLRGEMTDDLLVSKMLACWSRLRNHPPSPPAPVPLAAPGLRPITLSDALARSADSAAVYRDMAEIVGERFVSVDPPLTPAHIERRIEEHRPDLVVLDYLQLAEAEGFKDRRAELDHIVRRIAMASTRHELPIIVVSAVAKGTNEASEIGTLTKESNVLDFQAHTFVSLWTQGDRTAQPRRVRMRINKSRTARLIDDDLWFHGREQFYAPAAADTYEELDAFALP
jgi:replicative DNA helicase